MRATGRYLRTICQLRPEQVAHRLRLRAQKVIWLRFPGLARMLPASIPTAWGWPKGYVPLDARIPGDATRAEMIGAGRFEFLEVERYLGDPHDWQQADADQLWRFNLHYFEWAWQLAHHPDRQWAAEVFATLFRSWTEANPVGKWDAWSPYVASLRAWALCGVHEELWAGRPIEHEVVQLMVAHAGYVRWHLEKDVGGNHLIKNLKALIGLGCFLRDDRLIAVAAAELQRQVAIQVLPDGGHYERSPSYHAQVLGDLLDCERLLDAVGGFLDIGDTTARMRDWLGSVLLPDGDVALFNDSELIGRDRLAELEPTPDTADLTYLPTSGLIALRPSPRLHVLVDVGDPCPPELPAHAHADTLSFELSIDSRRIIVDPGTSTYAGQARQFERSTAAHNTITVDGADSTEVWGQFRAGRRARVAVEEISSAFSASRVVAAHDGFRHLPGSPRHRRTFLVASDELNVIDEVMGSGWHRIGLRLTIAPGLEAQLLTPTSARVGSATIESDVPLALRPAVVATGFGRTFATTALLLDVERQLPTMLHLSVRAAPPGPGPETDVPSVGQ